jgi:hypothetical protein
MNNNKYIKYCLLLLLPLIINSFSFNLISPFFVNKRVVNKPIKMCWGDSPYKADSSNNNLDNLNMNKIMNNFIKKNVVKTNNFIDTKISLSLSSSLLRGHKIQTNTLFFNTYYVDDLLIEKNLTRIILNLRKGNNSLYYINKTNNIETINNSSELSSKIIKNLIFTDLNKIMNNSFGIIYDDI